MADFRPTASQQAAIDTRGGAVLVSAGAGSGKTRVLTERLMGYICDDAHPVDLDSFLIITFTRAAAAELRGRIMEELAARLAADPGSRRLRRQSALCRRAQIGTIHSFCANVLRENCHALGLTPDFKIADEERAEAMRAAALERTLDARYDALDQLPGFRLLADTVGAGRDDRRLSDLVLKLHSRMQCHARPEDWARRQVAQLKAPAQDVAETPWGQELLSWAKRTADYWSREMDRLLEAMTAEEKVAAAYTESFSVTAAGIRELSRCLDLGWDRARACLPIEFPTLKRLMKSPNPALSDMLKARRTACKKAMDGMKDTLYSDSASLLREMELTAPAMEALLEVTLDFDREYTKDKRSRGLVDYSDLEHLTAQLLTNPDGSPTETAERISRRFTEIMVDEYQDVSRVQDAIFAAVSRDGKNLFMVGDVKQSIYRFRLADPAIFTEKYLSYSDYESAKASAPSRILLRENFRSRREILDGANSVFSLCMSRALGDMDYDDAAALRCGASYPASVPKPELMLLAMPESEDENSPDKTALEAELVARKINSLLAAGTTVTSNGGERPLEYGDIAILLRSANTVGGVYRRVLGEHGIPVSSVQGGGFFESVEVSTLISMLAVIDNPHKDIPLIAVLRSPSLSFSPDELSDIRSADKKADLYTALLTAAENNEKCRDFVQRLDALRGAAADLSAAELTWRVIEELDMLALCTAMGDGAQRRANLMALVGLSESFEATGYRGVHRYVLWLRRLAEKGQEPSTGGSFSSAVQIMSVHKSKGLEFPVVFLCDTARRFNRQDSRESVLVHPELGLGPKLIDLKRRIEYPTLARNAIRLRLEREMLSEEMRLLYVALTRPKERLFMTAALKDPEGTVEKLRTAVTRPMAPEVLSQAQSPVSWLIYAALADGGENLTLSYCSTSDTAESTELPDEKATEADAEILSELKRRLAFRYPYAEAVDLPSKVTATELKGHAEPDPDGERLVQDINYSFRMPELGDEERKLTAAERGVATHLVLQYMDFSKGRSLDGIRSEIDRLRAARFISAREAEAVNARAIERLFASPLGTRMLAAEKPMREFRFSLLMDADKLYGDAAKGEELLLQGVVDCCIEENGELVIIDYKTDYVKTEEDIAARSELYRGQLMAYAEALHRISGKPVKECVLYFLSADRAVTVYKAAED